MRRGLTEAGVLGEELCELVTLVLVVATAAAVTERGDADLGGAEVVGGQDGPCSESIHRQYHHNHFLLPTFTPYIQFNYLYIHPSIKKYIPSIHQSMY